MSTKPLLQARPLMALALIAGLLACNVAVARSRAVVLPDPNIGPAPAAGTLAAGKDEQVAVFAGGCFWGVEAVFEHVKGVKQAISGYAGGSRATAHYTLVAAGVTGHAEAVKVVFDPAVVSYGQLLKVFFSVVHDPTQLNRQGPDTGPQYRSAIFTANGTQKQIATAYIAQLTAAKAFGAPIVTEVAPLQAFYRAETNHQDYARRHPREPYIVHNDLPKVANLQRLFPALYER